MIDISRRNILSGATSAGLLAATGLSQAAPTGGKSLPRRGEFTVRGAYVLTFDHALGDLPKGDIHVRDGEIVSVGERVKGGGATIDGAGFIAMPGFVDTHQHMWTASFRGVTQDPKQYGYFAAKAKFGPLSTPQDTYRAVRLCMVQALNSGITTVNDIANNIRDGGHADATLSAHAESGLRSRFSYGPFDGMAPDQPTDFVDVERIRQKIAAGAGEGRVGFGVQLRPPPIGPAASPSSLSARDAKSFEMYKSDYAKARQMGLPIAVDGISNDGILQAAADGFLGPDFLCIHALGATKEARQAMKAAGAAYSCSPFTEFASLVGMPVIAEMLADGVLTTLSVDSTSNADSNMFTVARVAMDVVRLTDKDPFTYTMRDALGLATINGARALRLENQIGSLTPGKRADLILVRTQSLNLGVTPNANPYRLMISAQTEDVDTVVVDGRILKRGGRLVGIDVMAILREAAESIAGLRKRANWPETAL
jgi:cytosine/adenosine deaminase-related metal-dependent hydrolase